MQIIKRFLLSFGSCIALSGFAVSAHAATQGASGTTTNGTIGVTLTANLNARISGLDDIILGTWSGAGDMSGNDDLCIGRSGVGVFATGAYRIRASGDGDSGNINAFTLTNGANTVYYDVYFNDQVGLTGRQQLTAGLTLTAQSGLGWFQLLNWLFGCVSTNANVSVVVPATQLQSASSGNYAGTLTLVLIPD